MPCSKYSGRNHEERGQGNTYIASDTIFRSGKEPSAIAARTFLNVQASLGLFVGRNVLNVLYYRWWQVRVAPPLLIPSI